MHFSTVGFKDSLSVHVNLKYLNSLTNLIFSPFIDTFTTDLFTCVWNSWATVFDTFIGCFHFFEYAYTWLQIRVPSFSRYWIIGAKCFIMGGLMSIPRSAAKRCLEWAPRQFIKSLWYTINKYGLRLLPWGSPLWMSKTYDVFSSKTT